MKKERATIMLVDDSKADQTMVQRAFEDGGINVDFIIANDGEKALTRLNNNDNSANKPDLILLDINMPMLGGIETLRHIKADNKLCDIPIIMLTTSSRDKDIIKSYKIGVHAYLTKPINHVEFIEVIKGIESFELELVGL